MQLNDVLTRIWSSVAASLSSMDAEWMRRRRAVDTKLVFLYTAQRACAGQGMARVLAAFQAQGCTGLVSPSTITRAKGKLPAHAFLRAARAAVQQMSAGLPALGGLPALPALPALPQLQPDRPRLLAVDGSKLHVPPSLRREGFRPQRLHARVGAEAGDEGDGDEAGAASAAASSRRAAGERPLGLLSCMYDVH
ncbi:MAG: hypothetical protein ACK4F6_19160, partial [Hylemonella sp.]